MIELRTLGTIDLLGPDKARLEGLLRRPKRLALLAYMTIECPGGPGGRHRRDTVLSLFWPELDAIRARASLRQAMHVIRRAVGDDAFETVGDDVLLVAPHVIRCDAVEFVRAATEGRLEDALALYRGELLPGLFIAGAPDFEQWLDHTRQALRVRALRAAGDVADRALRAADFQAAVVAARHAIDIAPDDEPAHRRLMLALDRAGDRAGALATYDALAHRMTTEFDAEPSPESRTVAASVRSRTTTDMLVADIAEAAPCAPPTPWSSPGGRRAGRAPRPALLLAGALLTISLAGGTPRAEVSNRRTDAGPVLRRPIPSAARDAYERGLRFLEKPDEASLTRAVQFFEQARDSEPLYARALAGLGDAYLQLGYWNYLSPDASFPKAIAAAQRAIEIDGSLPEGFATLGFALMYYNHDWAGSERAFRRAIELDPTYAPARQRYAYLLTARGRSTEAQAEVARATELVPLSLSAATDAGFVLFYTDSLRAARTQLESVVMRNASSPGAHLWLARLEQREGQTEAALREYAAAGALRQWVPTIAGVGYIYGIRGDRARARATLTTLNTIARTHYVSSYAVALVFTALGERDSAFAALDRAVAERTNWLVWLARDRRWDPLRADPRFATLLRRVGLASR